MRKQRVWLLVMAVVVLCLVQAAAWAETRYVDRTKLDIKKGPGAFYPTVYTANQGESLEILEEKGGWFRVQTPNGPGWVFNKALTDQKSGGFSLARLVGSADTSELDKTAGAKGFDAATEEAYVSANNLGPQMKLVDQLQEVPFTVREFNEFIQSGHLAPSGGGQ